MYTLKNKDFATGYDVAVREEYKNDYEFNRWFIRPRNRAEYYMTYSAISTHLKDVSFESCLEFGSGPGTWTRLVYRRNPKATFQLVDISEAMYEQFRLEMRALPNVRYNISDVMEFQPSESVDFFFTSRMVEYLDDKPAFFARLPLFIKRSGRGMIVTKNPKHGVRKSKSPAHQGQILMSEMKEYLENNGFADINFFPVVIRIPILSRFNSSIAERVLKGWKNKNLNINATNRLVESYIVTFKRE